MYTTLNYYSRDDGLKAPGHLTQETEGNCYGSAAEHHPKPCEPAWHALNDILMMTRGAVGEFEDAYQHTGDSPAADSVAARAPVAQPSAQAVAAQANIESET